LPVFFVRLTVFFRVQDHCKTDFAVMTVVEAPFDRWGNRVVWIVWGYKPLCAAHLARLRVLPPFRSGWFWWVGFLTAGEEKDDRNDLNGFQESAFLGNSLLFRVFRDGLSLFAVGFAALRRTVSIVV
jgi:hypothetical protein